MSDRPSALDSISATGAGPGNARLWRSLEEWADSEAGHEFLAREFPDWPALWEMPVLRRRMLQLMGASLLLGGLGGCGEQPREEIVPYVRTPEDTLPGKPVQYATALSHAGYAQGVLVKSHEGRPTKVEGNPLHPASLGATDVFAQAAVLGLYDPDRSAVITNGSEIVSFEAFAGEISAQARRWAERRGAGLCLLTETITSPTRAGQMAELLRLYPEARWHVHEPVSRDNARAGARLAFGRDADTLYRFDKAKVIVSLDADFLTATPARTRYGHDFIEGRRVRSDRRAMNRLYVLESTPTLTGAMADHRRPLRAGQMQAVARALAGKLGMGGFSADEQMPVPEPWLDIAARELAAARGAGILIAGDHLSAPVHALVQAINEHLGNFGRTVVHIDPVAVQTPGEDGSLASLADELLTGRVETLIILGSNPVYSAPADLEFAKLLDRVPLRIHHGLYANETALHCHWHVPALHELESWSDARAYDGTVSLVQPLITPLYGGRSVHEILALLAGRVGVSDRDEARAHWRRERGAGDFELFWRGALRDGIVPDTVFRPLNLSVRPDALAGPGAPAAPPEGLEIRFSPDASLWDGRYANNGWLQEVPRPLTKLTWENALLLAPETGKRLGLETGEWVEIGLDGRRLNAPVWLMPGQPEDSAALALGYGRTRAGRVGNKTGVSAYAIRRSESPDFDEGLSIRKLEGRRDWITGSPRRLYTELPTSQRHFSIEAPELIKVLTLAQLGAKAPAVESQPSLYPNYRYDGHAWAMVVDLNACIGCNACVVACQAENNIPIVGREEVRRGRVMHWLRVDRYYGGAPENPKTYFQPVPCMHCEKAPCEPVCPVQASVHDSEGINNQVYNRCVGTRFCQSNCPYKVRRFNFFGYSARKATNQGAPMTASVRNPDVSVRSRGVMEKCTYCIQRINRVRYRAEMEHRPIGEGEVQTACQQACPTQAIVFGDLNAEGSHVAGLRREPQHYSLLEELGTRPRTTYLARMTNPNRELGDGDGENEQGAG